MTTPVKTLLLLSLFLLGAGALSRTYGSWNRTWAHERSRLSADKEVLWGRLSNGLRYALLRHPGIPERVSMKLLVHVGSVEENEDQLGIAHFIEHMAFNGTRHFQAGELASFFQQLGMEYGRDINATTSFDQTVYGLELWENNEGLLRKSLLLLRDIADGVLFESSEIDKERKVILSEMRGRDGISFRAEVDAYQLFFKGLTFTERIPIGTTESIQSMPREQFLKFYRKWYRPDLMVLVAVGDIEPSNLATLIEEYCGDLKVPSSPLPTRNIGRLQRSGSLKASTFRISHVGTANIRAASVIPARRRTDSLESRRQTFNRQFANALLEQRMSKAISGASNGSAGYSRFFGNDVAIASINTNGQQWRDAVLGLDRVVRFTLRDGFTLQDIDWLRKRQLVQTQRMRKFYPKLDPTTISNALVQSIVDDTVYVGLKQELAWQERFLRDLSIKTVHRSFNECWSQERMAFHISGEVDIEGGAKTILREVAGGRRERVDLYALGNQEDFDFEPSLLLKKGAVVESREIPEMNAHLMQFDNNIRFNFIESHHEPDLVRALVRVGGGLFDLNENKPGLREFALQAFLGSGTKRYRPDAIQSVLASSMLEFGFDVNDHDAFSFRATFGSEDLDLFLGIVTEYLNDPEVYRFSYQNARIGAAMQRFQSGIGMQDGYRAFQNFLFREDGRFAWGSFEDYGALGVTDVRKWLVDPLGRGYLELSIVGDVTRDRAVDSVSKTLGALGERRIEKKNPKPQRPVEIRAPLGYRQLEFVGEEHQAMVLGYWVVNQTLEFRDRIALEVLSRVIERRLWETLRENLGATYSPQTEFTSFLEYQNFAAIQASVDCAPEDAPSLARAILDISNDIAEHGVTDTDITEAAGPIRIKLRQAFLSNDFLLNVFLKRAQERPVSIDETLALKNGIVSTVTADEVNFFAKTIMVSENARSASIVPKPFIGIFQTEKN